jgi:predicted transcriptional regulator
MPQDLIEITVHAGIAYSAASAPTRMLASQGLIQRVATGKCIAFQLTPATEVK